MTEPDDYDEPGELALYSRNDELALVACIIHNPSAYDEAAKAVTGADLYEPKLERIWDTVASMRRAKRPVDFAGVLSELQADTSPTGRDALAILPTLLTWPSGYSSDAAAGFASEVRDYATRRRIATEAQRTGLEARDLGTDMGTFAARTVQAFAAIRDAGVVEDVSAVTLEELLAEPDDEPDWLIPGLLERQDRLMLTGDEGMGKSHFLRQVAVCAAAGLHPWTAERMAPIRTAIFDFENTDRQVRRGIRSVAGWASEFGAPGTLGRVNIRCAARIDVRRDRDLAAIHRELDAQQPDLIVIGPLYKLVPMAIQTDDDAAPVLAALDTIRDRGIAMMIEAHSGHVMGAAGSRNMRPRGSAALLGWPEFGYGIRDVGGPGKAYAEFVAWRGNRSERDFPTGLQRAHDGSGRWLPADIRDIMAGLAA